jgi:hypothetical protein
MLDSLATAFVSVAAIANIAMIVIYTLRAKWWRNSIGRVLFTQNASFACILLYSSIRRWTQPSTVMTTLGTVLVFALIAACEVAVLVGFSYTLFYPKKNFVFVQKSDVSVQ